MKLSRADYALRLLSFLLAFLLLSTVVAQVPTPGQNVNMVSGTGLPGGDPFLQRQNEPSIAVSTRNPLHLLAGANDYRSVDLPYPDVSSDDDNACPGQKCAEPWVGVFKSKDGGQTWQSVLLPGYPQDQSAAGLASPLKGLSTASDPVVRAGTNGLFYYSGIAFQRGTNNGAVFVSRFMDLDNKENGDATQDRDAIRYVDTTRVASGTATQFLDKPWLAVDMPRNSRTCNISVPQQGSVVAQNVPAGNVYVIYTAITNPSPGVFYSNLYLKRSLDCGNTWSAPVWVSRGYAKSQGATIQIDPETGIVYVAWRVFRVGTQPDAIVIAASLDGGQSFTPGFHLVQLPSYDANNPGAPSFFDQATTGGSFRTNAYPALAVGDSGFPFIPGPLYLAWSQRGIAPNPTDARVMVLAVPGNFMITPTGIKLPTPVAVDNGPLTGDDGLPLLTDLAGMLSRGHQFMPQMTVAGGKLSVAFYDQREDHTVGIFTPNAPFAPDGLGRFYLESRQLSGELLSSSGTVFTPFLTDQGLTIIRHTIDLRMAQASVSWGLPAFSYANVSRYQFGTVGTETGTITALKQLQLNPPNLPLFQQGTAPFIGDYIDIAGLSFTKGPMGFWRFNTLPSGDAVQYTSWTSNQDVRAPADGDWTHYTPVGSGSGRGSSYDPGQPVPDCIAGQAGMRNQNIYMSRITQGLLLTSPQNSKPLSNALQRAFVISAQNFTSLERSFRISISAPAGVYASFLQTANPPPANPPAPLTSLDVTIAAHSGIARSVFAFLTTSTNSAATITVTANEITTPANGITTQPCTTCVLVSGGLSTFLLLNQDGTVPSLLDPDGVSTGISNVEIYSSSLSNPNPSNPNPSNPNPSNPNPSNPNPSNPNPSNPNPSNPNPSNDNIANLNPSNPNPSNPNPSNTTPSSSATVNTDIANPNPSNPNPSNPNPSNTNLSDSPVSDATYTVTNTGDTTASYHVVLVGQNPGHDLQLMISKFYETPNVSSNADGTPGCQLVNESHTTVVSNVINPVVNPNPSNSSLSDSGITDGTDSNPTFQLAPGEKAYIVLRGFNVSNDPTAWTNLLAGTAPAVVSQAVNTNTNTRTTSVPGGVFITTATLPDGVVGSNYSQAFNAIGGTQPYIWNVDDPSDLPIGFAMNSQTGVLSFTANPGIFPAAGTYTFTVRVTDAAQVTNTKTVSLRLANPVIPPTQVPTAIVNGNYSVNLAQLTSGGIAPLHWTLTSVKPNTPAWLSLSDAGVLSGTGPALPGAYTAIVQVKDSSSPAQVASTALTVIVVAAAGTPQFFGQATDPLGDSTGATGSPDLVWSAVTTTSDGNVKVQVRFAQGTFDPNTTLVEFLLDTDQNFATGSPGSNAGCVDDANLLGIDYLVNMDSGYNNNLATIFRATGGCNNFAPVGTATSTVTPNGMDVTFPLSLLTSVAGPGVSGPAAAGPWNYKVTVSTLISNNAFTGVEDYMPNLGVAPASTAGSPLPVSPPSGMLLWYPADGYPSDIVGNHGTLFVGGVGYAPSEVGQSFTFNGDGSSIIVTDSGDLTPAAVTVDFWFKSNQDLNVDTQEAPLVLKLAAADDEKTHSKGYDFSYEFGGLIFGLAGPGQVRQLVGFPTTITAGTWHFVAGTYDGTGQNLYVDGVLVNSGANFGPVQYQSAPIQIGSVLNSAFNPTGAPFTYYFSGQIDELEVFNRALSATEILSLFNAGSAGKAK
jgi:hypothetical protein